MSIFDRRDKKIPNLEEVGEVRVMRRDGSRAELGELSWMVGIFSVYLQDCTFSFCRGAEASTSRMNLWASAVCVDGNLFHQLIINHLRCRCTGLILPYSLELFK